jgi:hypothetical protein
MLGDDTRHLQAIEASPLYLRQNPRDRILDVPGPKSTKEHHLNFSRHKKEVPPRGMNFAIEGKAVQQLYHAPAS